MYRWNEKTLSCDSIDTTIVTPDPIVPTPLP